MTALDITGGSPSAPSPTSRRNPWHDIVRKPSIQISGFVVLLLIAISAFPGFFASLFGNGDPRVCNLGDSGTGPASGHPFGFNLQGCDVYANVIYGTQASMTIGIFSTALMVLIAVVIGTLGGYFGGIIDWITSRLTDVFLGFPLLLAAVVVLSAMGTRSVWTVSLVLGLFGWPIVARVTRSSVRSVRDADYVRAARTMGISTVRILTHYVLPNSLTPVLVVGTLLTGGVIVAESSLTFLGIGLQAPAISWGLQLAAASGQFQNSPHLLIFPATFLAVTVLSLITLGDGLRTVLDPRHTL